MSESHGVTDQFFTPDEEFNPHRNRTADGVLITDGLRVFTNNLDRGTVIGKAHGGDHGRETDWWWKVMLHTRYDGADMRDLSPRKVVHMNGERMTTTFEGRRA